MIARTYSATLVGVNAVEVEIETHQGGGDFMMVVVGLPDAAVKESRDRVITALTTNGLFLGDGRLTVKNPFAGS